MRVFVTGGSGQTGPTVVSELLSAGHEVTGLARSDESAARLEVLGAAVYRGSLEDRDSLAAGAKAADGVLHMAHGGDFSDPEDLVRRDRTAVETLGQALIGSGKPFVSTSGTLVLPTGRVANEQDTPDPQGLAPFRIPGEQACLSFAAQGVRSSVVRLAPTVHGPGDYGFIPFLIAAARRTGISVYIADGANRWPAVNRLDAASLFRLALEKAGAGSALHGVGESAVTIKSVAEQIARNLEIAAVSLTPEEAADHFRNPFLARPSPPTRPSQAPTPSRCWAGHPTIRACWRTWRRATTSPQRPASAPRRSGPTDQSPRDQGFPRRRDTANGDLGGLLPTRALARDRSASIDPSKRRQHAVT